MAFILLLSLPLCAELTLPPILDDHMVLQCDKPVAVWGTTDAGAGVTVEFAGQRKSTTAGADGRWHVTLDPLEASSKPRDLLVTASNQKSEIQNRKFSDVLVGEVWLCSGQSNMEKPFGPRARQQPVEDSEAEIAAADHPRLRLFQMSHPSKVDQGSVREKWMPCSPEVLASMKFSAVGYFFGRELRHELERPVGVIHSSFGGTQIEAWMPAGSFGREPELRPLLHAKYPAWVEGVQPTELFQSMIAPLAPFTLRGFIWYQGETNCMNGESRIYTAKMRALIDGWRNTWGDAAAPFFYALIAPFHYSGTEEHPTTLTPFALPLFWEAQAEVLRIPETGVVVTTDLAGDARDIHPTNKRDVGARFARLALAHTYGRKTIVADSPRFLSMQRWRNGRLDLQFEHPAGGLRSRDGVPLTHFEIAGSDQRFFPAAAVIEGDTITVSSPRVPDPVAVRFAWHETANPNLVNGAGLPALPFRTDNWPVHSLREPEVTQTAP